MVKVPNVLHATEMIGDVGCLELQTSDNEMIKKMKKKGKGKGKEKEKEKEKEKRQKKPGSEPGLL